MQPLVSILIPCYNHELYIKDCIDSILSQSYKNIELIIIDDCSTDHSFQILKDQEKRLKEKFNRVLIMKNEINLGITKNMERLFSYAKGDYIKLLASDDMLLPDAIEDLLTCSLENPQADIIFGNAYIIEMNDSFNSINNLNKPKILYNTAPIEGRNLLNNMLADCYICAPAVLIPRRTIIKYGFYDTSLSFEDWEYWLRISARNGYFKYANKIVVAYRMCEKSASHFNHNNQELERYSKFLNDRIIVFEKYAPYCDKESIEIYINKLFAEALFLRWYSIFKKLLSLKRKYKSRFRAKLFLKSLYGLLRS